MNKGHPLSIYRLVLQFFLTITEALVIYRELHNTYIMTFIFSIMSLIAAIRNIIYYHNIKISSILNKKIEILTV